MRLGRLAGIYFLDRRVRAGIWIVGRYRQWHYRQWLLSERLRCDLIPLAGTLRLQELRVMNNSTRERRSPLGCFPCQSAPRLYDGVVEVLRARHYSCRTEEAYVHWIRRFILFHAGANPRELGGGAGDPFLTHLAAKGNVAAHFTLCLREKGRDTMFNVRSKSRPAPSTTKLTLTGRFRARRWHFGTWITLASVVLGPPLYAQRVQPPPPAQLEWRIPSLVATPKTELTQAKGGISLTVTPAAYQEKTKESSSFDPDSLGAYRADQRVFCKMYTSSISVSPERIAFSVTIANGLERVFRGAGFLGAGAVISLRVDGKSISFDPSGITELLNVVVLPEEKGQVAVYGPEISTLGESGTIDFLVYDVVTAVDAAGTPTQRQNYAWHYTYSVASHSKTVPIRGELFIGPTVQQARPAGPGDADWAVCPRWK